MASWKTVLGFSLLAFTTFASTTACSSTSTDDEASEGSSSVRACGGATGEPCPEGSECQPDGPGAYADGHCIDSATEVDANGSPEWDRCEVDTDCTAVPRVGCCEDGWKEAVNKTRVAEYSTSFDMSTCATTCPPFVIEDKRQPLCNHDKGRCEMVEIRDIACGGNSPNPHRCPAGYTCKTPDGSPADVPGRCVSDTPKPDDGCGGCGTGQWCAFCWGKLACIPVGASC